MASTVAKPSSRDTTMIPSDGNSSDLENSDLAGRIMEPKGSHDDMDKEDEATQAASEDLKHTTISDKDSVEDMDTTTTTESEQPLAEKIEPKTLKATTPEPVPSDDRDAEMKEQIASPKKKRSREQDDEAPDLKKAADEAEEPTTANGLAPQKKRHRDISVDRVVEAEATTTINDTLETESADKPLTSSSEGDALEKSPELAPKKVFGSDTFQTSSSAFKSSGFATAASSSSGFGALGGSKQPSVFGATLSGASAAGTSLSPEAPTTKGTFGSGYTPSTGFGSGSFGTVSTFGSSSGVFGAPSTGFGGPIGGFGSGPPKLSTFAAPSTPAIAGPEKPPKAFGAPESDAEDDSEEDESDEGENSEDEEKSSLADEKKKLKITKVTLESGEEGESTILQFQAKVFAIDNKAWKERCSGVLKLNVPKFTYDYVEGTSEPILGTFDPSAKDEDAEESDDPVPIIPRLIMRQNLTHRVMVNTPIVKGLKFEERAGAGGSNKVQILFTGFADGKHVPMLLRVTEAQSRLLLSEIASIQKEL